MNRAFLRHPAPVLLGILLAVAGAGCAKRSTWVMTPRPVEEAPRPVSPVAAVLRLQYDWQHRAIGSYGEILSDDFQFAFSPGDSAGNAFRDVPWRREDELISTRNLFVTGSGYDPPATNIVFDFISALVASDDTREGKDPRWHKQVHAQVLVRITAGDQGYYVRGAAQFYLVRGDSALIPAELRSRGFAADSARWWIERWEDETWQEGAVVQTRVSPSSPQPTRNATLGAVKALYR